MKKCLVIQSKKLLEKKEKSYDEIALYMGDRKKCSAYTKSDKPCTRWAQINKDLCKLHESDDKNICIGFVSRTSFRCNKLANSESLYCTSHENNHDIYFDQTREKLEFNY